MDWDRALAWTASLNVFFLAVGLAGGWFSSHPLARPTVETESVPVPIEVPPTALNPAKPEPNPLVNPIPEAVDVQPPPVFIVAPESPAVAFSVPVVGASFVAPIKLASPAPVRPMAVVQSPATNLAVVPAPPPVENFTAQGQPEFPLPEYPRQARLRGWQGEVRLLIVVGANGIPQTVTVEQSSGHPLLDQQAAEHVRRRWIWAVGGERRFRAPIIFKLQ